MTADKIKLILAALVLGAGVVAYYYLEQQSALVQVGAILAAVVVAAAIAMQSAPGQAAWVFARDSRTELRRVVWPTNKETMQTTMIVMAIVVLIALFLWFVDWALLKGVTFLTNQGKS